MKLNSTNQLHLRAAQGYVELHMFLEANLELEKMSKECRWLREVLTVKLKIFWGLQNWDLVQMVTVQLASAELRETRRVR